MKAENIIGKSVKLKSSAVKFYAEDYNSTQVNPFMIIESFDEYGNFYGKLFLEDKNIMIEASVQRHEFTVKRENKNVTVEGLTVTEDGDNYKVTGKGIDAVVTSDFKVIGKGSKVYSAEILEAVTLYIEQQDEQQEKQIKNNEEEENTIYKIFFEPNTKEVTANSIIRVNAQDLSQVTELKNWEYKIKDQFEDTYYIIPVKQRKNKKISARTKFTIESSKNEDFNYVTGEWEKSRERSYMITVTCSPEDKEQVIDMMYKHLTLAGCVTIEEESGKVIITEEIIADDKEHAKEQYNQFKQVLKSGE